MATVEKDIAILGTKEKIALVSSETPGCAKGTTKKYVRKWKRVTIIQAMSGLCRKEDTSTANENSDIPYKKIQENIKKIEDFGKRNTAKDIPVTKEIINQIKK